MGQHDCDSKPFIVMFRKANPVFGVTQQVLNFDIIRAGLCVQGLELINTAAKRETRQVVHRGF